jgi:hypothetical protein
MAKCEKRAVEEKMFKKSQQKTPKLQEKLSAPQESFSELEIYVFYL